MLYVGRDDFGTDRYLPLRGLTGICVSGLPGYGKTSLIASWLCQLTTTPAAQFALLDGKDGGDQEPWHDRAWRHAGDQLADALDVLEDQHAEMRRRLRTITALCGQRNAWNAGGPTEELPLLVTVIDECQTYLDLAQHKGDRALEGLARRCIALTGELIRKGRSVLCLTILATQKTTGDSIPTSLRDNSGLAVSFALKTTESSVAALGDAIREYPGYCPTLLRETPNGIGTAVATLTTGTDPFTRLRVPEITEQWAAERAAATACHRRDPRALVPAEPCPCSSSPRHSRPVATRPNGVTAMTAKRLTACSPSTRPPSCSARLPASRARLIAERKIRFVRVGSRRPHSRVRAQLPTSRPAQSSRSPPGRTAGAGRSDMPGRKSRSFRFASAAPVRPVASPLPRT